MLFLLACADPSLLDRLPADTSPASGSFRFVVIADPHVTSAGGENDARLDRAVDWINADGALSFALVVGDVGWAEGLAPARESLDRLAIPYVPINGDNEVQLGSEEAYHLAFATQYEALAASMEGWAMGSVAVANPEVGVTSWFHNVAFSFGGMRFVGLDWAARVIHPLLGEMGYLHDFEGGTWPFFEEQLTGDAGTFLFSHIPMHLSPGGFDIAQMERVTGVTADAPVWANFAGHYHGDGSETVEEGGYDVHVTDATWDDEVRVRIVEVSGGAYVTETVVVP